MIKNVIFIIRFLYIYIPGIVLKFSKCEQNWLREDNFKVSWCAVYVTKYLFWFQSSDRRELCMIMDTTPQVFTIIVTDYEKINSPSVIAFENW